MQKQLKKKSKEKIKQKVTKERGKAKRIKVKAKVTVMTMMMILTPMTTISQLIKGKKRMKIPKKAKVMLMEKIKVT